MIPSTYCFTTCRVGTEHALKAEMSRLRPKWHPAFSRPGFVSFKLPGPVPPDHRLDAVFVHAYGFSHGKSSLANAPADVLRFVAALAPATPPHLHCFARPLSESGELPTVLTQPAADLASRLHDSGAFAPDPAARDGTLVIDVLLVDADAVVFGCHIHGPSHSPHPGGRPPLEKPGDAPSRAWLKFEEAMLWHPAQVAAGQTAVEIGSAPGGTARALLARGARVIAVDPANMDPGLPLQHIRKTAAAVAPGDLPPAFDWLLIDINDNPGATMRWALHFAALSATPPSLLLTLKLSDWSLASEIPRHLHRLAKAGYPRARARQLFFGRREIVLLA